MLAPRALLLLIAVLLSTTLAETNNNQAYYLSPKGLERYPEVDNTLSKIAGQIKVQRTTYNRSTITYILDNATIGIAYNDAKQTIDVPKTDTVRVSGGRVEFTYRFNYTRIENRNNITGYAYGSVLSDPLVYNKTYDYTSGFLKWKLAPSGYRNLTIIENRMKIKRMDPFNQNDLENIEEMLDRATTAIDPSNYEVQILQRFNSFFPPALDDTLNHEAYANKVEYTFTSATHGEMKMNILRNVSEFGINPQDGSKMIYTTYIEDFQYPDCTKKLPNHYTFDVYGTPQTFHMHCLYQNVVKYLHSKGWLDTELNSNWESNSFQFYAGDLFDLINNLYLTFSPRAILDGTCAAQAQGLKFQPTREYDSNYCLDVTYACSMKGTNKEGSTAQVLKFKSNVKIYITAAAEAHTLSFKISEAEVLNLTFEPVGSYFVSNIKLAMFKANSVIRSILNTYTFGTGFPTLTRLAPNTKVEDNFVLYYDRSTLEGGILPEQTINGNQLPISQE